MVEGFLRDTGDELAADAVAWVLSCLVKGDGDSVRPEADG